MSPDRDDARTVMIMAIMEALSRVLRPHDTVYTRALRTMDGVDED